MDINKNFMALSTVFQSYPLNNKVIMKGYVQWNPIMVEKNSTSKIFYFKIESALKGKNLLIGEQTLFFMT